VRARSSLQPKHLIAGIEAGARDIMLESDAIYAGTRLGFNNHHKIEAAKFTGDNPFILLVATF
jgi:hypothetical protein